MNKTLINMARLTAVVLVAGYSNFAFAHAQDGTLGTLKGAGASDIYIVSCFKDAGEPSQLPTDHLSLNILNTTVGPLNQLLSAQVVAVNSKTGLLVGGNTTDVTGGTSTGSPYITVAAGEVNYTVLVDHNAKIAGSYTIDFHCQDASNVHTGTSIQTIQNQ